MGRIRSINLSTSFVLLFLAHHCQIERGRDKDTPDMLLANLQLASDIAPQPEAERVRWFQS